MPSITAFSGAVFGLGFVTVIMIQEVARAESLVDALTQSYHSNPALQADRARQLATDEQLPQARSGWLPSVSANLDYGYRSTTSRARDRAELATPPDWQNYNNRPYSYGITMTQPLFRGFRTVNETRKANANVAAGQAQLIDTEQTVLLDTIYAYLSVIRDRAIVIHRRKEVSIVGRILKSSNARFRNGIVTRTDVSQARARLDSARAVSDKTLVRLTESEAEFEKIVGRKPGKLVRPPDVGHLLPQSKDEAVRFAEKDNPKIKTAVENAKAAKYSRKAATGAFLPTVDLEVDYGHFNEVSRATDRREDLSVLFKVNVPIFTKGLNSSKVREAKAQEAQRRYEASDARYGVAAAAVSAYEEWLSARRRVDMIKQQVKAANSAARGVRLEQEVGDRTVLDVLNAEREVVNARVALENAEFERIASGYSLLATIGRLQAKYLQLPTAIYDATRNAKRVGTKFIGTSIPDLEESRDYTRDDAVVGNHDPVTTGSTGVAKSTGSMSALRLHGAVFLQDIAFLEPAEGDGKAKRRQAARIPRDRPRQIDPVRTSSVGNVKTADRKPAVSNSPSKRLAELIRANPGDRYFQFSD